MYKANDVIRLKKTGAIYQLVSPDPCGIDPVFGDDRYEGVFLGTEDDSVYKYFVGEHIKFLRNLHDPDKWELVSSFRWWVHTVLNEADHV